MIAIIILLSVIALITYPVINNLISDSREDLYNKQISELERLANSWVNQNITKLKTKDGYVYNLSFEELRNQGFIVDENIKNPKTGENLEGCVRVIFDSVEKKYNTKYDSECKLDEIVKEPTINLTVNSGILNSQGITTNDFDVNVIGTNITSYTYCIGSSKCEPTTKVNSSTGTITISQEGTNYVCVIGSDGENNTDKLCKRYIIDKTGVIVGTLVIDGTKGLNDWYVSDVNLSVNDSLGMTSTLNINKITSNTTGTDIVITTTDKDGNIATRTYNIKVDKTKPTITAKSMINEIEKGTNNTISSYFNTPKYSISGGSMSCNPANTGILSAGTHSLTCTVTGGSGLTSTATTSLIVKPEPNEPILFANMIPIKYESNKWVYADTSQEWYNYNEKEWANAVVLNSGTTKSVGDEIKESDIALWYVWIPRFKYTIFNGNNGSASEQLINITFESGTTTTGTTKCVNNSDGTETCSDTTNRSVTNGTSTYTHPAFTFGDTELTGFWIGKFEVSTTDSTCNSSLLLNPEDYNSSDYDTAINNCNKVSTINIKPNVSSWRYTRIANLFTSIQNVKTTYGITNADSHMMKNMEWGAVAYLKQSKYGLGTTDIGINNNSSYITGCGAEAESTGSSTCNAYNTSTGMLASTTGNIYGVYDMSGGAWEYTMGNMLNESNEFYSSGAGFSTVLDNKYYNAYKYSEFENDHGRGKLGDATKENLIEFGSTSGGWYSDYEVFPHNIYSWFSRGGYYGSKTVAGVFFFYYTNGYAGSNHSTRAILSSP